MKNLKLENILYDLRNDGRKLILLAFVLLLIFEAAGVYKLKTSSVPGEDELEKVAQYQKQEEEYQLTLESYEQRITEKSIALEEQEQMLASLTSYAETSPTMKLDPAGVKKASVEVTFTCAEGVDLGTVLQELLVYFNKGYYLRDLAASGEQEKVSELFSAVQTKTGLNLSLLHYDKARAETLLGNIRDGFLRFAEEQKVHRSGYEVQAGEMVLSEGENAAVLKQQNSVNSSLESYQAKCTGLEESIGKLQEDQEKYREEEKPAAVKVSGQPNKKKVLLFHGIAAILLTILLFLFVEIVRYMFNSAVYTEEDLLEIGLVPLCEEKKGQLVPEAARAGMDIQLQVKGRKNLAICMCSSGLSEENEILLKLLQELNALGIQSKIIHSGVSEGFDHQLIREEGCLIVVQKRKTALKELNGIMEVCRKYQIPVLGGVLLE